MSANVELSLGLAQALRQVPKASRYFVALSGGLDSIVLLHCFRLLHPAASLTAIHVNHGLSPNADKWAAHCQQVCQTLAIPCLVEDVTIIPEGDGIEAAARKARYDVFEQHLSKGEVLLQGHHQNDQAETVLMRALRGAGPKGLSAIPQERLLKNGACVYRPLLNISRSKLLEQAQQLTLSWVEDESNSDPSFDRNFIRNEILPVIEQRWPKAVSALVSVSQRSKETQRFVDAWCESNIQRILSKSYSNEACVALKSLESYSIEEQAMLLRFWLDSLGIKQPSDRIFQRIWSEIVPAKQDAQPIVQWGKYTLRRYDDCLFLVSESLCKPCAFKFELNILVKNHNYQINLPRSSICLCLCTGEAAADVVSHSSQLYVPSNLDRLTIRSREGGEKILIGGKRREVKKLLQACGVPPWRRDSFPFIYFDNTLIAIPGIAVTDQYRQENMRQVLKVSYG